MDEHAVRYPVEVAGETVSTLPLRVDRVVDGTEVTGQLLYCTGADGTELRVAVGEGPNVDRRWNTNRWYSFDGIGRAETRKAELLLSPEDGRAERIDTPEHGMQASPTDPDDPWLSQLGTSSEVLGVAVQVRPTGERRDVRAGDPESFEIGAVCLSPCGSTEEPTIYHREAPDTRDEHLLLQHVADDLAANQGATLLTRGTTPRPLTVLQTRLERAAAGDVVDSGAAQVLDGCFHANLTRVAARRGADTLRAVAEQLDVDVSPVLLSDYDIGIAPADWRESWSIDDSPLSGYSDPQMTDRDYAVLVQRYLDAADESPAVRELARCLKAHVRADRSLLRELVASDAVDQLGCSRLGQISSQ